MASHFTIKYNNYKAVFSRYRVKIQHASEFKSKLVKDNGKNWNRDIYYTHHSWKYEECQSHFILEFQSPHTPAPL